jgi:hypothetical protein
MCLVLRLGLNQTELEAKTVTSQIATATGERTWILETLHPKLSRSKIPRSNGGVEATSYRPCLVCSFDVCPSSGVDEERLG